MNGTMSVESTMTSKRLNRTGEGREQDAGSRRICQGTRQGTRLVRLGATQSRFKTV